MRCGCIASDKKGKFGECAEDWRLMIDSGYFNMR